MQHNAANWSATGLGDLSSRLSRFFVRRDTCYWQLYRPAALTNERAVGAGNLMETRGRVVLGVSGDVHQFALDLTVQLVLTAPLHIHN
jgi:hypothetical protein